MTDIDGIDTHIAPSGPGCLDCEADGSWWFHLRRCALCGHIGCCDDSLNGHATAHATSTGHPIVQSFEPGESWFFDYRTDDMFTGPVLAPPHHHPDAQATPGPDDRVPGNWQQILLDHRGR
ncbi:UBP-type zinc finger domain-containing protein [Williamsia sp.]|uniref:UBP-type zinc finger domain-containing protein n=1 Tax=Williamsia sp. TaxID=1872085 RepID=UPI001A2E6256|nr:UBP-type zinc finger domain-containing protein [Williamsia sp.]MBJ7287363.1 UBP-type zinc finger domain-containing protein [Williamsia sp.]